MSHASLAARYRPQTFAEVTGQDTVKAILSRSAAEDRVAPAYLLSGTRGVGKTTIARIFAKALNCEHAPTGEPCNQCEQCRRITQGNHVDVVEIDGASNRGIDDARRLREAIAYAPMEGRYKVFIIDEAHMLTRESFNALLKTLEEPPARSTFILATTEAHKFPVTIVSRCQHFVFKAIPEAGLVAHLTRILNLEHIPFEEAAVRLLARRAAGSVRDSMSLLGQTLALGGDQLTEAATRDVLGLAGQELYERLLHALKAQDCLAVAELCRELLERGVDLGFFLRELAVLWRNLFLLRQAGTAAADALDMPEAEKQRLLELAPQFDPAYIHAAWQMVLESQRQVLTSLEPSSALELLLLNLALLPRLVSLEALSRAVPTAAPAASSTEKAHSVHSAALCPPSRPEAHDLRPAPGKPAPLPAPAVPLPRTPREEHRPAARQDDPPPWDPAPAEDCSVTFCDHMVSAKPEAPTRQTPSRVPAEEAVSPQGSAFHAETPRIVPSTEQAIPKNDPKHLWSDFLTWYAGQENDQAFFNQLGTIQGTFTKEDLTLATSSSFQYEQFTLPDRLIQLKQLGERFVGHPLEVRTLPPASPRKTEAELKKEMAKEPLIQALAEHFNASLLRCIPTEDIRAQHEQRTKKRKGKKASRENSNEEHE